MNIITLKKVVLLVKIYYFYNFNFKYHILNFQSQTQSYILAREIDVNIQNVKHNLIQVQESLLLINVKVIYKNFYFLNKLQYHLINKFEIN